jgi:EF hand
MMKRTKAAVLIGFGLSLAVAVALPASAQVISTRHGDDLPPPPDSVDRVVAGGQVTGGGGFRAPEGVKVVRPGALLFASFDKNFDGRISAEELDAGVAGAFAAADKNHDGAISGFEQNDWAASVGGGTDVLSNPMTFDQNLDRSVTKAEFTTGLKRIAGQNASAPGADLTYADLVKPLGGKEDQQAERGGGGSLGTLQPRVGTTGPISNPNPNTSGGG